MRFILFKLLSYFDKIKSTSFIKNILDSLVMLISGFILCVILFFIGLVTKTIDFDKLLKVITPHTVESSFSQSKQIQKTLDAFQITHSVSFIGNFRFHNGVTSFSGFNFIKLSLTEYSSDIDVEVNPTLFQNISIVNLMDLVQYAVDDKCFTGELEHKHPMYYSFLVVGSSYISACPIKKNGNVVGMVIVGSRNSLLEKDTIEVTNNILLYSSR